LFTEVFLSLLTKKFSVASGSFPLFVGCFKFPLPHKLDSEEDVGILLCGKTLSLLAALEKFEVKLLDCDI
jgi:hypothetical protein